MHLPVPSGCPSHLPAAGSTVLCPPLLPRHGSFCPKSNRPGWLAGCVPWGDPSRLQPGSGMSPPHGPMASMAVHKNSWLELGTLNWPILQGLPELPAPARPPTRSPPTANCPRSLTDRESFLAGFACENPFGRPLEAWPPDQPAKLQSKASDLHESSPKGRSRMADLDCNLSRSVPEFFLLLLLRGEKPGECEERRWMESACAQRRQLASAPPLLRCWRVIHLPIRPHVCLCVVQRLSPPGWGRGRWAEPGPFTDWAAPRSISLSGDRTPARGTGVLCSVQFRVLQGSMGPMGSKQSSPKSQTHQQGSHLLISLERSGVKNC